MKIGWRTDKPEEVEEDYLVTNFRESRQLAIARWTNKRFIGHIIESDWHWETGSPYTEDGVMAWMPLPVPYPNRNGI